MYISLRNITVSYAQLTALNNISLNIEKGEIFGLIGPNGSGKTTLLKVMIGLLRPREGKILVNDKEVRPTRKEMRRILGYSPQENSFFDKLTVKENIQFFAELYDLGSQSGKLAEGLTQLLNLHNKIDVYAEKLSGGMKRRLNIACSIVHNPDILLLDEPTVELDPFARSSLWELIKAINRTGSTVIVSTNSMEEADFLCKRVAFLLNGEVKYVGRPRDVRKQIRMQAWSE